MAGRSSTSDPAAGQDPSADDRGGHETEGESGGGAVTQAHAIDHDDDVARSIVDERMHQLAEFALEHGVRQLVWCGPLSTLDLETSEADHGGTRPGKCLQHGLCLIDADVHAREHRHRTTTDRVGGLLRQSWCDAHGTLVREFLADGHRAHRRIDRRSECSRQQVGETVVTVGLCNEHDRTIAHGDIADDVNRNGRELEMWSLREGLDGLSDHRAAMVTWIRHECDHGRVFGGVLECVANSLGAIEMVGREPNSPRRDLALDTTVVLRLVDADEDDLRAHRTSALEDSQRSRRTVVEDQRSS